MDDFNEIGFGGNVSGVLRPAKKPVLTTKERKAAILDDKDVAFKIAGNPDADDRRPWHAIYSYSEVKTNEKTIEREAKKAGVDPNMVKAIVHLETTQGWYDRIALGHESSIRPMNVEAEYWKDMGYRREDLRDKEKNIQAGVELLKRIQRRVPGASAAKVSSIYKSLSAKKVSNYGARVERLMKEKPWEE